MTKPAKGSVHPAKTQISLGIRPVWSESSLSALNNIEYFLMQTVKTLIRLVPNADSEDSDQTGQMHRLIWVFAGRKGHFVGFVMRAQTLNGNKILTKIMDHQGP